MHWYDSRDGTPQYTIVGKNGKERATTIKDAREKKLVPSVTTITGILDKPGLLNYFLKQTIGACFGEERQKEGESFDTYVDRIVAASRRESQESAKKGSKLHDALEKYFFGQGKHGDWIPFIDSVSQAVDTIVAIDTWIPEESFSHVFGFGGKVDLYSKAGYIIDFKTKDTIDRKKFYKYDEHLMQLAAYRLGLNLSNARCFDIYISSVEPGIIEVHEWSQEDLERGEKMFLHLLEYWKIKNKYESGYEREI